MLIHLSEMYQDKNQIRKSFKCIYEAIEISQSIQNKFRLGDCFYRLSNLHVETGDLDSALY